VSCAAPWWLLPLSRPFSPIWLRCRLLASLSHPNIVRFAEAFIIEASGSTFVA
jgi:hypothetical protein